MADIRELLARVGLDRLHDMSITTKSMSDDVREQAKEAHTKYEGPLEDLVTKIESVMEPSVLATSLTKIGESVESYQLLSGWTDKLAFWG
jgi:hypothetical protein